ncbi:serine/threonine-protein phosphatase 7 long form homolog [Fagus crenata]
MVEPKGVIFEEREELMVSPTGGNPTLRIAHFPKPSVNSIDGLPSPFLSVKPTISELKNLPLKVKFKGWQCPHEKWRMWVANLHSKYQSISKKAGIFEAIMGSKYSISRHQDLVLGLAEKWCPKTNTFIFPWGEATVTLEDMMVLGGYSVLVATYGAFIASHHAWLEHFMGSGSKFEHEAFLSCWLSKFVFPNMPYYFIENIYTDLGLLKERLMDSTKLDTEKVLNLSAPFQLVQLWACEKFPTFRLTPISITHDEPRPARWHKLKQVSIENVRLAIDSAEENFQWRPYVIAANNNWLFPKFYGDKEQWVSVVDSLDKELESFAQCLRVCELVGLHYIQKYLPHRVAMQFGIDQDLPGHVAGYSKSPVIAWSNYTSSIGDEKLYIPPRLFEPDVTTRYFEWWKQSMYAQKDAVQHFVRRPRNSKRVPRVYSGKMENYNIFAPPSSSPKCHEVDMKDSVKETNLLGTLSEKKLAIDANPLTVSLCQSASHSTADDGAAKNDLQMIPMTCRR